MWHQQRRTIWLILMVASALLASAPSSAVAAPVERCFDATGYCISADIRRFWEGNGGLAVFGYPITPQQSELIENQPRQVQWFQRHRLELHPEHSWPYNVQLGRLGADHLSRMGRDLSAPVAATPASGCLFFEATGHNLCGDFLRAWRASGIESDGRRSLSEVENAALFGLPLTDPQQEMLADGQAYLVQWFERARMELHQEQPQRPAVLLGLLGTEAQPIASAAPERNLTEPTLIVIPTIGLNQSVVPVGVNERGEPIVPDHDAGWFNQSARPGEGENIVLWGHVLRFSSAPNIPAPFAGLKDLRPGDQIVLHSRGGNAHRYEVKRQVWVRPQEVAYILPQGRELLTMVSCIGDQVIQNGEVVDMSHRLITIAEPVD